MTILYQKVTVINNEWPSSVVALILPLCAIMCALMVIYNQLDFGTKKNEAACKTLNITIPEDLNYTGVFDEILEKNTTSCELIRAKTTNMGSLFRLTYNMTLKDVSKEKEMIDRLRCRNLNLEITVSRQEAATTEL